MAATHCNPTKEVAETGHNVVATHEMIMMTTVWWRGVADGDLMMTCVEDEWLGGGGGGGGCCGRARGSVMDGGSESRCYRLTINWL